MNYLELPNLSRYELSRVYKYRNQIEYLQKINATTLANQVLSYEVDCRVITKNWLKRNKSILKNSNVTFNRVAYVWGDRGVVVGGQIQGTDFDKKRFGKAGSEKKVMDGSEEIAGFNVSLGKPKVLYIFSTPEELLGFWTLYRNELKGCKLQSLPKYDGDVAMELIDQN